MKRPILPLLSRIEKDRFSRADAETRNEKIRNRKTFETRRVATEKLVKKKNPDTLAAKRRLIIAFAAAAAAAATAFATEQCDQKLWLKNALYEKMGPTISRKGLAQRF